MVSLQAWLNDDSARRNILVVAKVYDVVATSEITVYLSNCHYITTDSVTIFKPIISGNFSVSESLSLDGGYSISYGDVELYNNNGEYDDWLDSTKYVWVNREISVYVGDSTWTMASIADIATTFHLIFNGLIADIDCKSNTRLSIKVRDKQEKLNTPVTEEKMDTDGTWSDQQPNVDEIKPLVFGEVHNIEPILIDPATLKYRFSTDVCEEVIEIRDNGVPIYTYPSLTTGATINLSDGTFVLTHPAVGQLTVSVQGRKKSVDLSTGTLADTYVNNVANIIAVICLEYGKVGVTNLVASDLDLTSFSSLSASVSSHPVGIYLGTQKQNIIEVCKQLADSVGAQMFFNRLGKLQLIRLGTYISGSSVDITEDDMIFGSLGISSRSTPTAATKIAYCKNWTVQTGILTGIPEEHKEMFAKEWYYSTVVDTTVKTRYKLNEEVEPKETLLLTKASADAEAARLNNYNSETRTVYRFTGKSNLLSLNVGQQIVLFHHRFGLWNSGSGTSGQVLAVSPDWVSGTNQIEVIV